MKYINCFFSHEKKNTFNEKRRVIMICLIYILKFAMFFKTGIYIYICINIMRGKKDATTFPEKPVS